MKVPKFLQKDPFTRKELKKLYEGYPEYVIDFVYESFFMGAMTTLSHVGSPTFPEIMDEYARFLEFVASFNLEIDNEQEIRDQLIRTELQALLDEAKKEPSE